MRNFMSVLVGAMLAGPAIVLGQTGDANKVLADMRAALGGADKVGAVHTLTAEGIIQRVTPRGTLELTTEVAMELPQKFVARTQLTNQGAMSIYRDAGFNGDGLINATDIPPDLAGAGTRARLGSDRAGPGAGGAEPTPEEKAAAAQRLLLTSKKEFARLTLGMFGSSYAGFPVEFRYAGVAESPDGSAHVIGVTGADGFDVQLYVDAKTSLPLMLVWSEPGAGAAAGTMVERRLYYSNFRKVGDLNLPHTLQRAVGGTMREETTFNEIQINPAIDGKKFAVSK